MTLRSSPFYHLSVTTAVSRDRTLQEVLSASQHGSAVSSAQRIAAILRSGILSGEISRGMTVSESTIAASLSVSRNTAREALRLLAGEGLLSQVPNHSYVVTLLSEDDVRDLFAVRTILEHSAADMVGSLDSVDWGHLKRPVDRLQWLAESKDDLEVLEADREFHLALVEAAQSPRLSSLYSRLEGEIRLCLSISTRAHRNVEELVVQHQELLDLLREGQSRQFKTALTKHLDIAVDRVVRAIRTGRDVQSEQS